MSNVKKTVKHKHFLSMFLLILFMRLRDIEFKQCQQKNTISDKILKNS